MNEIKAFIRRNLQVILLSLCGAILLAGILTFVFGVGDNDEALKVLFVLLGSVLVILAILFAVLSYVIGSYEKANFFLYDAKLRSNVPLDELNFELINKKMTYVMSRLTSTASKVWTENVFENENEILGDGDQFAPLVAYKIIYDLSERANEGVWNLYLMADKKIIDAISEALCKNGDDELANAFKYLHENAGGSYDRTEKFLLDNRKYIQAKMVKYVKSNIELF